ncbi:hypothetical protein ACOMHN_020760 [Nucella lapillus]
MKTVLSGKKAITEKKEVVASSIAQDMCYAVTNGTWKMPKHVLLGTAIRHLTGSAEMISITNHFGHCISHSSVLELETDVCNSLLQSNSLLPATILKEDNVTLHFCWDNFDLQEETASGAGTTHSAHGIAIQEVTSGTQVTTHLQELEQQHSSRQRTVDYQPQPLQPCFVNQKVEPKLNIVETTLGKLVRGSGLGDVIVQSGICASGSIEAVLAGKHYNRALRVHKNQDSTVYHLVPVPESVQEALLSADTRGKEAFNIFITERLVNKTLSFHAPLKKVGLKTFASVHKTKTVRASSNKTIQVAAQRDIFGQLMMISQENNINLQKVMCYPLSPIPWSMATPDGMPAKTDKSKLMQLLEKEQVLQDLDRSKCTSIVDGMVLLHSLTALPSTFAELADKVLRCLPASTRVDFVADTYHPDSIKMMKRIRRGQSETFLLSGPNTKVPRDWKKFLSNGENKNQLIEFLLSEWMKDCYAEKLLNKQLYVTSGTKCFRLTSMDGKCTQGHPVPELESTQEEADTRIILHCFHQDSSTEPEGIIIRSIDTDVFVLLLHFSSQFNKKVYMDTGTGNHRRMICMSDLAASYDKDFCEALLGIHAFSGCDSTSSFITKGKKTVIKTVSKHKVFQDTFCSLGRQSLSSDTLESLEHFVCCLYNRPKVKYVNQLRFDLLKEKFDTKKGPLLACYNGTDLSLLPPCQCTLQMHIQRVHYQVEVWKSAGEAQPAIDGPAGRGWEITEEGGLEIRWSEEDILPQELVDILCDQHVPEEENEDFELVNLCDAVQEEGCEEGCDTEESTNE